MPNQNPDSDEIEEPIEILNLYAGIGGNRKLWDEVTDVEVTAVEIKEEIANIYQDFFPDDKVVVVDAHKYLKEHFEEFDFIWSSPPCPTHSHVRNVANVGTGQSEPVYPDMELYEEIIFLKRVRKSKGTDFNGDYCVENVISYYEPLIKPQKLHRHYFWVSFNIPKKKFETDRVHSWRGANKRYGFDLSEYDLQKKRKGTILRNVLRPKLGKHILKSALKDKQQTIEMIEND